MPISQNGSALALKEKGLRREVWIGECLLVFRSALALKEKGLRPRLGYRIGQMQWFSIGPEGKGIETTRICHLRRSVACSALALKEKGLRRSAETTRTCWGQFSIGPEGKGIETSPVGTGMVSD